MTFQWEKQRFFTNKIWFFPFQKVSGVLNCLEVFSGWQWVMWLRMNHFARWPRNADRERLEKSSFWLADETFKITPKMLYQLYSSNCLILSKLLFSLSKNSSPERIYRVVYSISHSVTWEKSKKWASKWTRKEITIWRWPEKCCLPMSFLKKGQVLWYDCSENLECMREKLFKNQNNWTKTSCVYSLALLN